MKTFTYNFHDKILINSDIPCFSGYFKIPDIDYRKLQDEISYQLNIKVGSSSFFEEIKKEKKASFGQYYAYDANSIYYEKTFFGSKFRLLLENLDKEQTTFTFSKNLIQKIKISLPMTDIYSFQNYFNSIFVVKMLQNKLALVHSSAIQLPSGEGILFSAFPDTGKTTTAVRLLDNPGSKILSDDVHYIGKDNVAYLSIPPYNISLHTVAENDLAKKFGFKYLRARRDINTIMRRFSFLPYVPNCISNIGMNVDIKSEMKDKVINSTKIDKIIFLENSDDEIIERLDSNAALNKIIPICERELYFLNSNNLILSYGYVNSSVNIKTLKNSYYEILSIICKNSDCYLLRAKNPSRFNELIKGIL